MDEPRYCVIGGTSGIGAALARRLMSAGSGVVTASRRADGPVGVEHRCWEAGDAPFPVRAGEAFDGVVYLPGSIRLKPFARLRADDFRADFDLNVVGAVTALQALFPTLRAAAGDASAPVADGAAPTRSGSVVLVSSVAARTGLGFHASIAAAKAAVEGLGRSLAAEWAPHIRVNVVAPSLTDTPLAARLLGSGNQRAAAAARHPMQRIADADDVAATIAWLLGPESGFVTGQVVGVDGGLGTLR